MHGVPSDPNQWVGLFFLFVVFPLWLSGMGTFVFFWVHVAPSALQRWADAEGYQIIRRKNPRLRDEWSLISNSGHSRIYGFAYRVIVRDKAGQMQEGLVVVGGPGWYCISVRRCPVKVRWEGAKPRVLTLTHTDRKHALRDSELG